MNNLNNINLKHIMDKILKAVFFFPLNKFFLFWQIRITRWYKTFQRHFYLNNNNNNTTKLEYNSYLFCNNYVVIPKS